MRRSFAIVVGLFAALILGSAVGCGGGKNEPAKAPETNPWADYKGTYAGAPEARTPEPVKPKADSKDSVGSVASATKTEENVAAPAVPVKKAAGKKRPKAAAKKPAKADR